MPAAQIRALFRQLSSTQKTDLLRELEDSLCRDPLPPDRAGMLREIREARFRDGHVCPHCGSKKVVKNGRYRDRQWYWCRDCDKTFNDLTNSPLNGVRKLERMLEYSS